MPNVLAHTLFCQEVLEQLEDKNIQTIIRENMKLYHVGAQGPDIFFYYKSLLPTEKVVAEAGQIMHRSGTAGFFLDAIHRMETISGRDYEVFISYISGFLTHYYLDRKINPYIQYIIRYGAFETNGNTVGINSAQAENMIDSELWKHKKQTDWETVDQSKLININYLPDLIVEYLLEYFESTHQMYLYDYHINNSIKSMIKVLRFLYDPQNKKKKFVEFLERIIGDVKVPKKREFLSNNKNLDICNLEHHQWNYIGKTKRSSLSALELFDQAKEECVHCLNNITRYLEKGEATNIKGNIPDVSYITDLPDHGSNKDSKMKSIFGKKTS